MATIFYSSFEVGIARLRANPTLRSSTGTIMITGQVLHPAEVSSLTLGLHCSCISAVNLSSFGPERRSAGNRRVHYFFFCPPIHLPSCLPGSLGEGGCLNCSFVQMEKLPIQAEGLQLLKKYMRVFSPYFLLWRRFVLGLRGEVGTFRLKIYKAQDLNLNSMNSEQVHPLSFNS